jgi:hypothetical protein
MSELQPSTAQPTSLTPQDNTAKINALIAYGIRCCIKNMSYSLLIFLIRWK